MGIIQRNTKNNVGSIETNFKEGGGWTGLTSEINEVMKGKSHLINLRNRKLGLISEIENKRGRGK